MFSVLHNSPSVHAKLRRLFSKRTRGRRRVAIVAYVGRDACELIPDFTGVELFCWPQIGATDPDTLAQLQGAPHHAKVRLVDGLHIKLYWVEKEGFVITSANLSRRALAENVQEEIGIYSDDPSFIPIDQIIGRLPSRPLSARELQSLKIQHDEYWATVSRRPKGPKRKAPTFMQWLDNGRLPKWKIGWFDGYAMERASTARAARTGYGVTSVHDFMPCSRGQLTPGDWVLCFRIGHDDRITDPSWLRVDFVNDLSRGEAAKVGYTQEAVQLRPLTSEHRTPFQIDLKTLRRALRSYGIEGIKEARDLRPNEKLIDLLADA